LRSFQPTGPPDNDQVGFLYATNKERWAFGGNRSGKTEIVVADCILLCIGFHPVRSAIDYSIYAQWANMDVQVNGETTIDTANVENSVKSQTTGGRGIPGTPTPPTDDVWAEAPLPDPQPAFPPHDFQKFQEPDYPFPNILPLHPDIPPDSFQKINSQKGFSYKYDGCCYLFSNPSEVTSFQLNWPDFFKKNIKPLQYEPPCYVRFCAVTDGKIDDTILKKFKQMVPRCYLKGGKWDDAWSEKRRSLFFKNGSIIKFLSYKSYETSPEVYGGDDLHGVYMDEHCRHEIYLENSARLTDYDGYLCAAMTPEEGQIWEEDHVTEGRAGTDVNHWFFSTESNPYLRKEGVESFKATLGHDEALMATKLHGEFVSRSGLVIPQFDRGVSVIPDFELPKHWMRTFVVDLHIKIPHALMWLCWTPEGEVIVYRTAKKKLVIQALKRYIRRKCIGEHISDWIGDEPMGGKGKNAFGQDSLIGQLQDGPDGFPVVQAARSNALFDAGINKLREGFSRRPETKRPTILIFKSCDYPTENVDGKIHGSLIWELRKYSFRKNRGSEETLREQIRNVDDHLISCLRMGIMAGPIDTGGGDFDFDIGGYGG
jgi:phage terminase large subunit-like protein